MARSKTHRKPPCKCKGYHPPVPAREQKPSETADTVLADMAQRLLKFRAEFIGIEKYAEK